MKTLSGETWRRPPGLERIGRGRLSRKHGSSKVWKRGGSRAPPMQRSSCPGGDVHAARRLKNLFTATVSSFSHPCISRISARMTVQYCAFRVPNKSISTKSAQPGEIAEEIRYLVRNGHKRIPARLRRSLSKRWPGLCLGVHRDIYGIREGNGEIRRVNAEIAPLTVEEFRRLRKSKIGTYVLFQETYHLATYKKMHLSGPKADYHWRLNAMGRALEGHR